MGQNSSKRNNNNTPRPQSNQQRPQVRKSAPPQQRQVKNCVPLGLYPECSWDLNILKKHIGNKNLAPIFKGTDQNLTDLEECPICFLVHFSYYFTIIFNFSHFQQKIVLSWWFKSFKLL